MLAYAAQGRRDERGATGPGIRHFLSRLDAALGALPHCAAGACLELGSKDDCTGMLAVLAEDARKAHALIRFVLSRETIGSQLADNLNASIHLRALLTDLFVLDESRRSRPLLARMATEGPVCGVGTDVLMPESRALEYPGLLANNCRNKEQSDQRYTLASSTLIHTCSVHLK